MINPKNVIIILAAGTTLVLGAWGAFEYTRPVPPEQPARKTIEHAPCASVEGGVAQPCAPVGVVSIPPTPPLLSAGMGTTTLKKATPLNDILIAETGSPYANIRNARYTMWPYPGEIPFKEVYLVLPDTYEVLFPGYSNKQFIEFGDTKSIMLYLRHSASTGIGADARIVISPPATTTDHDHAVEQFDSADLWTGFSLVSQGKEVIIELVLSPSLQDNPIRKEDIRKELARALKEIEIFW